MHYRRETLILFIDFGIFWSSSPAVFCSQFLLQLAEYSVAQSSLDGLAVQPGTVHLLSSQPSRNMLLICSQRETIQEVKQAQLTSQVDFAGDGKYDSPGIPNILLRHF